MHIKEYVIHDMLLLDINIHCVNCGLLAQGIVESENDFIPVCSEHEPAGIKNSSINSTGYYTEIIYWN